MITLDARVCIYVGRPAFDVVIMYFNSVQNMTHGVPSISGPFKDSKVDFYRLPDLPEINTVFPLGHWIVLVTWKGGVFCTDSSFQSVFRLKDESDSVCLTSVFVDGLLCVSGNIYQFSTDGQVPQLEPLWEGFGDGWRGSHYFLENKGVDRSRCIYSIGDSSIKKLNCPESARFVEGVELVYDVDNARLLGVDGCVLTSGCEEARSSGCPLECFGYLGAAFIVFKSGFLRISADTEGEFVALSDLEGLSSEAFIRRAYAESGCCLLQVLDGRDMYFVKACIKGDDVAVSKAFLRSEGYRGSECFTFGALVGGFFITDIRNNFVALSTSTFEYEVLPLVERKRYNRMIYSEGSIYFWPAIGQFALAKVTPV